MASDALRAAKLHLQELAAGKVAARDKPRALHHGLLQRLVLELEAALGVAGSEHSEHCEYCAKSKPSKNGRFCSDKCRSAWHREHDPRGAVKTVRRLKHGATAVVVHFGDPDAERAIRLMPGQAVVLGEVR